MQRSDDELIEAARAGDASATDELLAAHEQKLYRFSLRMCGDEDAAREVLQETMLAAFRGLAGFRGEAKLSTWLYQIARGYCVKTRRLAVGEPASLEGLESASAVEAPLQSTDLRTHSREIGEALHAAILALPEPLREAVVLRDVEELDGDEAAKVLGIELAALKSRLHRGRAELRLHLAVLLEPSSASSSPCPELARELRQFSTDDIDRATCSGIERHLAACSRCAENCVQLGKSASLCCSMPGDEVPRAVRASVRHAMMSALDRTGPSA